MKLKKIDTVQREIILLMVSLFICFIIFFGGRASFMGIHAETADNEHPGIIRLHIVANSDSQEDQELKLKVRDEILKFMEGQDDASQCRKYLESHLGDITRIADEVISSEGFDYKASAELGVFFIPKKSYEDLTLPAGNYEALRIVLGDGNGHNWWCVIFPELCLIDSSSDGEDNGDKQSRLIIKSRIKERIRNIYRSRLIY